MGAALAVLAVAFVFFARGWIGGGDAKLAAATAFGSASISCWPIFVYASLFGGVLTLLMIRFRLVPLPAFLARQEWASACTGSTPACPTASRSPPPRSWSTRIPTWMTARRPVAFKRAAYFGKRVSAVNSHLDTPH